MARNIFGLAGEKTFKYRQGDFDVVVGYLNELARYCATVRRSGPLKELSSSELSIVLSMNAPAALWTIDVPETPAKTSAKGKAVKTTQPVRTTHLRYVERDPKVKERSSAKSSGGCQHARRNAFFCLPAMEGQPHLLASEWAVNQALG